MSRTYRRERPLLGFRASGNFESSGFEKDEHLRTQFFDLFSTGASPGQSAQSLQNLLCCLPTLENIPLSYENVFRIIIMQFYDSHSFDIRPIKKTCVHIVQADGRVIPFDTMNTFYRDPEVMRGIVGGGEYGGA